MDEDVVAVVHVLQERRVRLLDALVLALLHVLQVLVPHLVEGDANDREEHAQHDERVHEDEGKEQERHQYVVRGHEPADVRRAHEHVQERDERTVEVLVGVGRRAVAHEERDREPQDAHEHDPEQHEAVAHGPRARVRELRERGHVPEVLEDLEKTKNHVHGVQGVDAHGHVGDLCQVRREAAVQVDVVEGPIRRPEQDRDPQQGHEQIGREVDHLEPVPEAVEINLPVLHELPDLPQRVQHAHDVEEQLAEGAPPLLPPGLALQAVAPELPI